MNGLTTVVLLKIISWIAKALVGILGTIQTSLRLRLARNISMTQRTHQLMNGGKYSITFFLENLPFFDSFLLRCLAILLRPGTLRNFDTLVQWLSTAWWDTFSELVRWHLLTGLFRLPLLTVSYIFCRGSAPEQPDGSPGDGRGTSVVQLSCLV